MRRVIIQAGGKGARLHPYTTVIPKPLMPVDEKPILEIVIRQLIHYNFKRITITTGHLFHLIHAFFGDGSRWGAEITYQTEDKSLGTIGPIRRVKDLKEPFLVMNGDLLTDINYHHFYDSHLHSDAELSVACYLKKIPISLGVIHHDEDGRIASFQEKPTIQFPVSMGIYVVNPSLIELIPGEDNFGFDQFIDKILSRQRKAIVYRYNGLWLDIGRHEDYETATKLFLENRSSFFPWEKARA